MPQDKSVDHIPQKLSQVSLADRQTVCLIQTGAKVTPEAIDNSVKQQELNELKCCKSVSRGDFKVKIYARIKC